MWQFLLKPKSRNNYQWKWYWWFVLSIYTTIIKSIINSLGKGSDWIIDLVIDHTISIPKYNTLAGSSPIESIKIKLGHPLKGLFNIQKQPPRGVPRKNCSENVQQIYRRTPMPKCDFNNVALQIYWNHTLTWVFSCKFAAYFQNSFS